MTVKFSCKISEKPVAKNHQAIQCDSCNHWIHIKCNKIKLETYKHLQSSIAELYCIKCFANIIPFSKLSHQQLFETNQGKKIKFKVITKPLPSKNSLIDELNSAIDGTNNDLAASNYFEPKEISFVINEQTSSLSFLLLNISSLPHHFEDFSTILTENKLDFELLGIFESRIKLNGTPIFSIQLLGYKLEYTLTESSNGGTLIYIKKT